MASPVERVAVAWNGVFAPMSVNVPGKVEALDTAIADALEAEREMKAAWKSLEKHPNDDYSRSVLTKYLGGE